MKAIVVPQLGSGLKDVKLADLPIPEPAMGEVRLRVHAASLNPVDWKLAVDNRVDWVFPHVLGVDAAGVVDVVGEGVEDWRPGDRVVVHNDLSKPGVFAEFAIAPAHVLTRVPDGVSFVDAAAVPCAGYTAFQGLSRKARLEAGQTILIQGANGGVGGFAVQLAHAAGAKVIALAKPEHHDGLRKLGADVLFDYRDPDLVVKVKNETEGRYGVDVMLEVVNPGDARLSFSFIRYNGHLVSIDPMPNTAQVMPYTHAISVHEVALGGAYGAGHVPTQRDFAKIGDDMMQRLANGTLDSMVEEVIAIEDIPHGLARLRRREVTGKIVARLCEG